MVKVLNIAQFVPVEGLYPDNDVSLKTYSDLNKYYGVSCEFVKPVGHITKMAAILRKSSKIRRSLYFGKAYFDRKHKIKVHFYRGTFPFINRIPFDTGFLLPFELKIYGKALFDLVEEYKPDLIHAHSIFPDAYYAMRISERYNLPYIVTVRGTYTKKYHSGTGRRILSGAASVTTPSYSLWEKLSKDYGIELLPHGIEEEWFNKKRRSFSPDKIRLTTVCRLLKMKNIHVVLRSVSRLINEGYNVVYDIIGEGDFRIDLIALTRRLGLAEVVRFHGHQDADYIRKVYENSDIFVMLSYPETFGISYFEAAAMGLYIVGVKGTGSYGYFNGDEASFIDIDEQQLTDLLKGLSVKEMETRSARAMEKSRMFHNHQIIERYFNIIKSSI